MAQPMGYCKVTVVEDKETLTEYYGLLGHHKYKIEKNGKSVTLIINDQTLLDTKIHPQVSFPQNDSVTFHINFKDGSLEKMQLSYDIVKGRLLSAIFQDYQSSVRCFERD